MWNLGSWWYEVGLAHCWALRHQAREAWFVVVPGWGVLRGASWGCVLWLALLCPSVTVWLSVGVGGVVV